MVINRGQFSGFFAQIFWRIVILIASLSALFTTILIDRQNQSLTQKLIESGQYHAKNLAAASELGVFAENPDFLHSSVNRTISEHDIIDAGIYANNGRMLASGSAKNHAPIKDGNQPLEMPLKKASFYRKLENQNGDILEFWSPVIASIQLSEEDLLLDLGFAKMDLDMPKDKNLSLMETGNVIGMVRVRMSQARINQQLQDYIYTGISITLLFLPVGLAVAYLMAKEISGPLLKLTKGVELVER